MAYWGQLTVDVNKPATVEKSLTQTGDWLKPGTFSISAMAAGLRPWDLFPKRLQGRRIGHSEDLTLL